MKWLGKFLALAMLGEGITLYFAAESYLKMWQRVFHDLSHWMDWFEDRKMLTRKLAVIEIVFALLLLRQMRKSS